MKKPALAIILFLAAAVGAAAQAQPNRCLTDVEAKKLLESIDSAAPTVSLKENIRRELIDLSAEREKLSARIAADPAQNQSLVTEANRLGERNLLRVCALLKEHGWLGKDAIGEDGVAALADLIAGNRAVREQRELLPVLSAAAKKGLIGNSLLATLVDQIRLAAGQPQIFGTQATIRGDVLYLYPLQNEEKVDQWREMYDLAPLAVQIRRLESNYWRPLLKSPRPPRAANSAANAPDEAGAATSALGLTDDETEVLKVDTKIVNLNVRLLTPDLKPAAAADLKKEDFVVAENGVEQEILFFSAAERPFDLVLLLDFSSSTIGKRGLIKRAAQRFVEAVRADDRVAVVAFTNEIKVVAEPTSDKKALIEQIKDIEMEGGSSVWDSVEYVYENIVRRSSAGRRSAIVLMTDGEDNSRESTFADVIESVREGETTVFPVYLRGGSGGGRNRHNLARLAQQSLALLAEESGGQVYRADDAKDLAGVYEQVASDLGKIYSLGYEPRAAERDGAWRQISVKIKNRADLIARTRRGYYAR